MCVKAFCNVRKSRGMKYQGRQNMGKSRNKVSTQMKTIYVLDTLLGVNGSLANRWLEGSLGNCWSLNVHMRVV